MTNPRTAIRHAVMDQLKTRTGAGDRVFSSMLAPVFPKDCPFLLVYCRREQLDPEGADQPGFRRRTVELFIEIAVTGAGLEEQLDAIAAEVEAVMDNFPIHYSSIEAIFLRATEFDYYDQGEYPIGAASLAYDIVHFN